MREQQHASKNRFSNNTVLDVLYEDPGPKARHKIFVFTAISLALIIIIILLILRQFYITGQLGARYWRFFAKWTTWAFLFSGLIGTVRVALMSAVITFVLGFLFMFGRVRGYKPVRLFATVLIEFTRGVPTLLFIYFFFFGMPLLGIKMSAFWKITIPVAVSASGAVAEVLRGGVNAVHKGQREAALSLGLTENRTFFKIIFPQAFKFVIPSLISDLVIVLKDTTFAYVVSFNDLMQNSSVLISNYDALLSVYLVAAIIYILINYFLNKLSVALSQKRR